ncbi:MAG: DUF3842 family protein [Halothermotrichaceae bacterium]
MKIAVIDGLGGGLGCQIIDGLKKQLNGSFEIIALATNSQAVSRMIKAGADTGASGENAIRVTSAKVDIIIGPLGIIIPNSMWGEITPGMAEAILGSSSEKFILGLKQPHVELIGLKEENSINDLIEEVLERVAEFINN